MEKTGERFSELEGGSIDDPTQRTEKKNNKNVF